MHIFLSYSRQDSTAVAQLRSVLTAFGIHTWIDTQGLAPGTPQWDIEVRRALERATAVVVLCTESARDSPFVSIELEIARGNGKSIIPVWISGEIWPNCAPTSLVLSQHIDLRPKFIGDGFTRLRETLAKTLSQCKPGQNSGSDPWPWTLIEWNGRRERINIFAYTNRGELLADVFVKLLGADFKPFSYGSDWVLEISCSQDPFDFYSWPAFALPANWASHPHAAVDLLAPDWVYSPPSELLAAGSTIRVLKMDDIQQKAHHAFRGQLDWNNSDSRKNFLGLKTFHPGFSIFIQGKHPKMTVMEINKEQYDRSDRFEYRKSFERFNTEVPCFELVTLNSTFFKYFQRSTEGRVSADGGVLDFSM
jgi:hypothetical protein